MEKKENKWEDEKVTLTEVLIEKSLEEKLLLLLLDSGPLQKVLDWLKLEACPACSGREKTWWDSRRAIWNDSKRET